MHGQQNITFIFFIKVTFKGRQTVRINTVKDKRNYILRKCDIL